MQPSHSQASRLIVPAVDSRQEIKLTHRITVGSLVRRQPPSSLVESCYCQGLMHNPIITKQKRLSGFGVLAITFSGFFSPVLTLRATPV